jgi:hypothetical protein
MVKYCAGVTAQVPVTCVPPPPAPLVDPPENPDPPPPPRTVSVTDVTPAGTAQFDKDENVTTTGDAADADELVTNEHHTATPTSAPTHARARLASIPKPDSHGADTRRRPPASANATTDSRAPRSNEGGSRRIIISPNADSPQPPRVTAETCQA